MTKAVQFDSYGGIDVLEVREVPRPVAGTGEVLVDIETRVPVLPLPLTSSVLFVFQCVVGPSKGQ